ncbi:MAG: ABC transporter permease, partial [Syntrophomonadaceae bacterium]|nr:ABC transporter permease [Syntrophomonadaceae bacterium]
MRWQTIKYFFREAKTSLRRNSVLSLATATTIAICVFILGIAVLLYMNSGEVIQKLESDVEIVAFLEEDLTPYQTEELQRTLKKNPAISSVTFVSKDEALGRLEDKMGGGEYGLLETMEGSNPLHDSLEIKAANPREVGDLAVKVEKMEGVSKVRYGQDLVQRLFSATRWVRILSVVIVVFLGMAAVFLVATTTRLTIFSRRKEIYIMKLVGATNRFIRFPFFLEGIALSVSGTLFALLFLGLGYFYLIENVQPALAFLPMVTDINVLIQMGLGLTLAGMALG